MSFQRKFNVRVRLKKPSLLARFKLIVVKEHCRTKIRLRELGFIAVRIDCLTLKHDTHKIWTFENMNKLAVIWCGQFYEGGFR